jgi:hypothetical protein
MTDELVVDRNGTELRVDDLVVWANSPYSSCHVFKLSKLNRYLCEGLYGRDPGVFEYTVSLPTSSLVLWRRADV